MIIRIADIIFGDYGMEMKKGQAKGWYEVSLKITINLLYGVSNNYRA